MTASSVILLLVGLFVILNASNFVGVVQGTRKINFRGIGETTPTDEFDE